MYPVFLNMVEMFGLVSVMQAQVQSLEAMFLVVDMLLAKPPKAPGHVRVLQDAMVNAMSCHKTAYEDRILVPKWHAALHIPQQIFDRGHTWATFVHERKHKLFKRYATAVTNTTRFEKRVSMNIVNHQMLSMRTIVIISLLVLFWFSQHIVWMEPYSVSMRMFEFQRLHRTIWSRLRLVTLFFLKTRLLHRPWAPSLLDD